jgi:hypothetical protein
MDLLCTCKDKMIECGSIVVDAVKIVVAGYKAMAITYTCREVEMVGFQESCLLLKRVENGKEVKVLEVYV